MGSIFYLADIPVEVEYRKLKVMRLTVYPAGRVMIAAPEGTSPVSVRQFAVSKVEWIKKQREKFGARKERAAGEKPEPGRNRTRGLRNHSAVYVWGEELELELIERKGNPKIIIEGGCMKMYIRPLSPGGAPLDLLDKWYRRTLKESAEPIIKKWEAIIGVEIKKLFLRKMKTHWGSCNFKRQTIRLNSQLVKRKPECLEYVIVHEMLHIIEKGHNRKFYRLLGKYIPAWKSIRKELNTGPL